jgi:hypothetical protein
MLAMVSVGEASATVNDIEGLADFMINESVPDTQGIMEMRQVGQ